MHFTVRSHFWCGRPTEWLPPAHYRVPVPACTLLLLALEPKRGIEPLTFHVAMGAPPLSYSGIHRPGMGAVVRSATDVRRSMFGNGDWIRTNALRVMSPAGC